MNESVRVEFPWNGRFTTAEQIEDYFSGEDRIQCLLCGKWRRALAGHLNFVHGVSPDEYRARYGLPWRRGLVCKHVSRKLSRVMTTRIKNGFKPPVEKARKYLKNAVYRPDQPFFSNIKSQLTKSLNKPKYPPAVFERVLSLMRTQKLNLRQVCLQNKDLPRTATVFAHADANPAFKQSLRETYYALPYAAQARAGIYSPQFYRDLKRLRKMGLSGREIGARLGVPTSTIQRQLTKIANS